MRGIYRGFLVGLVIASLSFLAPVIPTTHANNSMCKTSSLFVRVAHACSGMITGYTGHGVHQAISRDGHGVSTRAIRDSVRRPTEVQPQPDRGTTKYVGKDAVVILNGNREVVSAWAKGRRAWRY